MTRIEARPGEVVTADVAPAASAAEAEVKKKGPPTKDAHPSIADGAKLDAVPEDYDATKHAALKEENFNGNKLDVFYRFKAAGYEAKAAEWIAKAEQFARLGGVADKKAAMNLNKHTDAMRKTLEALIAQGDDVSGLPAAMFEMCGMSKPA